jgi:phosphoribosylformylglycinamidine cyclo-ligase
MGIGFCIIAPKDEVSYVESIIKKHHVKSQQIGNIVPKTGVFVNSTKIA